MKIYITRGDQRAGPYSLAQINAFLNIGRLSLDDHAWFEGCLDWIRVKGIPGVRVVGAQTSSSNTAPQQQRQPVLHSLVTHPKTVRPQKATRPGAQPIVRTTRIPCRICESGELLKTTLPRFSRSLNALGMILLLMSLIGVTAIVLASLPYDPVTADATPISVGIAGFQLLQLAHPGSALMALKKAVLANWQFIFLSSFGGFIFSFLFQTKKHVLQCSYCESVVSIE